MARLEDITVGSTVKGIAGNEPVSIVAVQWYGTNVIDITYKNSQNVPGTQLLYREDEYHIEVMDNNLPWSFDADLSCHKRCCYIRLAMGAHSRMSESRLQMQDAPCQQFCFEQKQRERTLGRTCFQGR